MQKLIHEPLFHFLLIGAAIFALNALVGDTEERQDEIVISAGQIDSMVEIFRRIWQRPPTATELTHLIDDRVREEIYYREAQAMGLDDDDTIIRRRLRQKLEFLTDDLASLQTPDESALRDYFAENIDEYRAEPRLTFEQLYFSRDRRDDATGDAQAVLVTLSEDADGYPDAADSDPISLQTGYTGLRSSEVDRLFGTGFAKQLAGSPVGQWSGPVESGYGVHLVRVSEIEEPSEPEYEQHAGVVLREWERERREEFNEVYYDELMRRYDVTIEYPEWASASTQGGQR